VRDYVHVSDLARAHLLAVDRLMAGGASFAVNLGSGRGYSIREVLRTIGELTGRNVPARVEHRRPGDPPAVFADPRLARETIGFSAEMSDLPTIVATTARSFGLEIRA
jgi:UDP-arabinose 4-epimerase